MNAATIKRWLRDTVTLTKPGGIDQYGQPAPGTSSSVAARIVHDHKRSRTPEGLEFISTTQVATLASVHVGDTLTIDGVARPVRAVKTATGLHGGAALTEAQL